MTKLLLGLTLSLLLLEANSINLTAKQEQDWQIQTAIPKVSSSLPLGECMSEVVTPPQHLHTITLAFEAQVKKLHVALYDSVKKGQLLAELTGKDWIEIQQQFIEERLELQQQQEVLNRKSRLCREGIIAKKECITANALYKAQKSKLSASKALLKGYGASDKLINRLSNKLKISQTIPVYAEVSGKVLKLNIQSGKSTVPSDALFIILKEGALWLQMDILAKKAMLLKKGQKVQIVFNGESFESKVLLHAPMINPENQTQQVRFSLPNSSKFLSGMRNPARIIQTEKVMQVAKKSVINLGGENVVFLKNDKGYKALAVEILGEEGLDYYLKEMPELHASIAVSSLLILKTLMEGEDE